MGKIENFKEAILKNSVEKNEYDIAIKEWIKIVETTDGNICCCGTTTCKNCIELAIN